MKQTLPAVHCLYTEAGKSLAELLEESFRLYLAGILATPEGAFVNIREERPLISEGRSQCILK